MNALFGLIGDNACASQFAGAATLMTSLTGQETRALVEQSNCRIGAIGFGHVDAERASVAVMASATVGAVGRVMRDGRAMDAPDLAAAWRAGGVRALTGLEGSHHLLVLDHTTATAHIFADALGTTPLYYASEAGRLAFGPSQRGVLALLGREPRISRAGALRFLMDRYPSGTDCMLEGIRRLGPGERLAFSLAEGRVAVQRDWDLKFDHEITAPAAAAECLYEAALQSHREMFQELDEGKDYRMFLTGGLDSRGILGFADQLGCKPAETITWGGRDGLADSDPDIARSLAGSVGVAHRFIRIDPEDWCRHAPGWALTSELASDNANSFASSPDMFQRIAGADTAFFVVGDQMLGAGPLPGSIDQAIDNVMRTALRGPDTALAALLKTESRVALERQFDADMQKLAARCPSQDFKDIQDYLFFHNYINRWILAPGNFKFPMVPVRRPLMTLRMVDACARLAPLQRVDKRAYVGMVERHFPALARFPLTSRDAGVDWAGALRNSEHFRTVVRDLVAPERLEALPIGADLDMDAVSAFVRAFFTGTDAVNARPGGRVYRMLYDTRRVLSRNRVLARAASWVQPLVMHATGLRQAERQGQAHRVLMRLALLSLFNQRISSVAPGTSR